MGYYGKNQTSETKLCLYCGHQIKPRPYDSKRKFNICDACVKRIFFNHFDFYSEQGEKEPERKALEKICMILNLYYSDEIVDHIKKHYSGIHWKKGIKSGYNIDRYIQYVTSTSQIKYKVYMKTYEDTILERFQKKNMQQDM